MTVEGQLALADPSGDPALGSITIRTFTEGAEINGADLTGSSGSEASNQEGRFRIKVLSEDWGSTCGSVFTVEPEFPPPDRLVVSVEREGCAPVEIPIELNGDTVVDMGFPDKVIELRNSIVVPPCEGE